MTPDANGWMPIETAPNGRHILWMEGNGVCLGWVKVYPDERIYRADGFNGTWPITKWQPLPKPPVYGGSK